MIKYTVKQLKDSEFIYEVNTDDFEYDNEIFMKIATWCVENLAPGDFRVADPLKQQKNVSYTMRVIFYNDLAETAFKLRWL